MLKLRKEYLKDNGAQWKKAGVKLPEYDIEAVSKRSEEKPLWVHFGAGNIFRAYIARLHQQLLDAGDCDRGIIAAETFDYEIVDKIYKPHNNLTLLAGISPDGKLKKEIIASISQGIKADTETLKDIFISESLQLITLTITEKGYTVKDINGNWITAVREDIKSGPDKPGHVISIITAMLFERYKNGEFPVSLVSLDNCSKNGMVLQNAVLSIAQAWAENGFIDQNFINYLNNEKVVAFPWSMIDKITPRPSETVQRQLEEIGVVEIEPIITSKGTYIAPFVNAEIPEYLVIEDNFPNGRPPLEKAGVYFTDRETVQKAETMKVTTCLNPLHTAMCVYGCLLGYTSI